MPEVPIQQKLWDDFQAVALRQKKRPEALAHQVLREYLSRWSDEELLARSSESARKTTFLSSEAESIIRRYRRNKRT